jgi:hypothetical protein
MVLIFALLACAPKAPEVSAATPLPIDVALVAAPMGDAPPGDAPARLADGVDALLSARNLVPRRVEASSWGEAFAGKRVATQRMSWLTEREGHGSAVLLVSLEPRYFGFVSGRYRWSVQVEIVVQDASRPEHAVVDTFEVPALLTWDHEREDAAIAAASPVIERRIAERVEDWLGG